MPSVLMDTPPAILTTVGNNFESEYSRGLRLNRWTYLCFPLPQSAVLYVIEITSQYGNRRLPDIDTDLLVPHRGTGPGVIHRAFRPNEAARTAPEGLHVPLSRLTLSTVPITSIFFGGYI